MEPIRTCISCKKKGNKEQFIKIVKDKYGNILIDEDKKLSGRGYYVCNTKECIERLKNNKRTTQILGKENINNVINKIGGTQN